MCPPKSANGTRSPPRTRAANARHTDPPSLADLYAARHRISPLLWRTPVFVSESLSHIAGARIHCKLETVQRSGSFKARGAANAILAASPEARAAGVVTYSTGNHGRAVAAIARAARTRAVVCVSSSVPANKLAALRAEQAEVVVAGASQDEAAAAANRLARDRGLLLVDPINDPHVIAGHGTIGLELVEDLTDLDVVLVPVSGGALASGVALAVKSLRPHARVIGVSMERGAAMHASLRAGKPVLIDEVPSLADSLQGGILLDNRYTFAMVRDLVDDLVLVSEAEIARAMAFALEREHMVLEGAAAVGIAAVLRGTLVRAGECAAYIATGANVDPRQVGEIAQRERASLAHIGPPVRTLPP